MQDLGEISLEPTDIAGCADIATRDMKDAEDMMRTANDRPSEKTHTVLHRPSGVPSALHRSEMPWSLKRARIRAHQYEEKPLRATKVWPMKASPDSVFISRIEEAIMPVGQRTVMKNHY
jgi:hypothetical protein